MTTQIGKISPRLEQMMDRNAMLRMVRAMLDGSGLVVRALRSGLVITNPHDRDKGRIYIEFKTGHVTWERAVQEHWGLLQGYEDDNSVGESSVDAQKILSTLCGSKRGDQEC
jgi:hypothetical protein